MTCRLGAESYALSAHVYSTWAGRFALCQEHRHERSPCLLVSSQHGGFKVAWISTWQLRSPCASIKVNKEGNSNTFRIHSHKSPDVISTMFNLLKESQAQPESFYGHIKIVANIKSIFTIQSCEYNKFFLILFSVEMVTHVFSRHQEKLD